MNRDNENPQEQNENKPKERINLNDYYRKDDSDILKGSAGSRQDVQRSLGEQTRGTDDTINDTLTSKPNHI